MIAISLDLRPALLAAAGLSLALACGGHQEVRSADGGDCGRLRAGMTSDAIDATAACLNGVGTAEAAEACRDGVEVADVASAAALADLAHCVMSASERQDGVWLADMMASAGSAEGIAALAGVFADAFDTSTHAVTFTASLDETTQRELGAALPGIDTAARDALVALAFAYDVTPLTEYCAPYAGDLAPDDPTMVVFAERLASSDEELGEFERRILLDTGTWTAQDAIECYSGHDPRCANWEGESPLEAMETAHLVEIGLPSTPASALRLLRSDTIDPASARGLAAFIGGADYSNREALMNSMLLDMTDAGVRREIRQAIASAATAPMCEYDRARDLLLRAKAADGDRFTDANAPWPTFVRACAERHWDEDTLFAALSAGSWLGVPRETWEAMLTELDGRLDGVSCDELRAIGQAAYGRNSWVLMRGTAQVVAARVGGEACAPLLAGPVEDVATNSAEHPEARLAAYAWMQSNGDDAGCRRIDGLLDWYSEDYGEGPGVYAEAIAAELRAGCR